MYARWISAVLAATAVMACDRAVQSPEEGDTAVGLPNPAASFCIEQGGEYDLDSGLCRFEDGTEVDAWDYFREHAEPSTE